MLQKKDVILTALVLVVLGMFIGVALSCTVFITNANAEDEDVLTYQRWILCQPGSEVLLREKPKKNARITGALICGDRIETDDVDRNGYLHILGVGEYGEAWVSLRYVAYTEPQEVNKVMHVWDKGRVASRKWINGKRKAWLKAGAEVTVYWMDREWAVTDKGYINLDYLIEKKGETGR